MSGLDETATNVPIVAHTFQGTCGEPLIITIYLLCVVPGIDAETCESI